MKMYLIRFFYTFVLLMISSLILTAIGLEITKIWWLYLILYIACDYFAKRIYLKRHGIELLALDFENEKGNFEFVADYKSKKYLLTGFFPNGFINNTLLKSKLSARLLKDGANKENLINVLNGQGEESIVNINYEREAVTVVIKLKSLLNK